MTMRGRVAGLGLLAVGLLTATRAGGDQASFGALSMVGEPARSVVAEIGRRERLELRVAPDLAECKLVVVTSTATGRQLMAQVARVLGAEWVAIPGCGGQELRRTSRVQDWLKAWRKARGDAERAAREYQAGVVRRFLRLAIAGASSPPVLAADGTPQLPTAVGSVPLARLLGTLGTADFEGLVQHVAGLSPVRDGDRWSTAPVLFARPYKSLNPNQQGLIREFLQADGSDARHPASRILLSLDQAVVTFGSSGRGVDVGVSSASDGIEYRRFAAGAASAPAGVEAELQAHLFRVLSKLETPEGALLGARIREDGTAAPLVGGDATLSGEPPWRTPERPLRADFLQSAARVLHLNVVADHHTRSARLSANTQGPALGVVATAAKTFQTVFRVDGSFLLARNLFWPDRDDEETRAPHPETWLATKAAGGSLTLQELQVMGGLTDAQLAGLDAYRDGRAELRLEVETVRDSRWVWGLLATLSQREMRAARAATGLAIAGLELRQRNFIREHVPGEGGWERARLYLTDDNVTDVTGVKGFRLVQIRVAGSGQVLWHTYLPRSR